MAELVAVELSPRLALRVSPLPVAYAEVLALPMLEMEAAAEREFGRNPALERVERPVCAICGDAAVRRGCLSCDRIGRARGQQPAPLPVATVAAGRGPLDVLLADLRVLVAGPDRPIVEYLVASLDERGLLDATVVEIAARLGVEPARVRGVLTAVQEAGRRGSPPRTCASRCCSSWTGVPPAEPCTSWPG